MDETEFFNFDGNTYCRFHLPMLEPKLGLVAKNRWLEARPKSEVFFRTIAGHIESAVEAGELLNLSGVVFRAIWTSKGARFQNPFGFLRNSINVQNFRT